MKILTAILLVFGLVACGEQTPPAQAPKTESIFVLVENGGTIMKEDQGEALNTALNLFQQLTTLGRRRATKNTQIHIVLSALPNRIAWSGTRRSAIGAGGRCKEPHYLQAFVFRSGDGVRANRNHRQSNAARYHSLVLDRHNHSCAVSNHR